MDRPWRILLVADSLDVGGAERHVVDLARALRENGHQVIVAASAGGLLARDLTPAALSSCIRGEQAVKRRLSASYAYWLRRIIREERLDLVHAHCFASSAAAAVATLGTGVPLIVTEHSEGLWKGPAAHTVSRWVCGRAAAITAVSASLRRELIGRYGAPPERLHAIPNGIAPRPPMPEPGLSRFPQRGTGSLVGVAARLQPEKGVGDFLDAAARLVPLRPDLRFVVIGDGPLREALRAQAERLGLAHHVHLAGFQPDARALLPALDVLAVPSLSEGAPLVILEAMAAGVPIVATTAGGIPEQIGHGREGVLVPPGDPRALAAGIAGLLDNPSRARCLAAAARRRVHVHFTLQAMVREIEEVYRQALGAAPDGALRDAADGARECPAPAS